MASVCLPVSWIMQKQLNRFSQNVVEGDTWAMEETIRSHYIRIKEVIVMVSWGHCHTLHMC